VLDLPGRETGALWTHWTRGHHPGSLLLLPDCPATDHRTGRPCCEYARHPGGHTYQLTDPWHAEAGSYRQTESCTGAVPTRGRVRPRRLHHEPTAVTWAREKAGLTKRALARTVGISEQLAGEIESGWRSATPANLARIAEALNCPLVLLERKKGA
jgi:DNA-binding XRE family transcriptional regulator